MFASCNEDEVPKEKNYSTKLDGKYDLVSMICETDVDLDHDGVFSNDIMNETHEEINMERYLLEIQTHIVDETKRNDVQVIKLWAPYTNVFSDDNGKFLYTAYSYTNMDVKYEYLEGSNSINTWNPLGEGEILSAKTTKDGGITVRFKQIYYTTNGWEKLIINSTYKKRI